MKLPQKLEQGEFVVLAEMEPPKGTDIEAMVTNARRVKGKVDAFIVPEMSNAVMRMSSLGGALVLQNQGLECVIQVCCRDRNRLAIQGDLLAAGALGISGVMAVTGEDPSFGDHHQARAVNDIDLIQLLGVVEDLKKGRDMAGIELAGAPDFLLGTTSDSGAWQVSRNGSGGDEEAGGCRGEIFRDAAAVRSGSHPAVHAPDGWQFGGDIADGSAAQVFGNGSIYRPQHALYPYPGRACRKDSDGAGQGEGVRMDCVGDDFELEGGRVCGCGDFHYRVGA